MHSFKAYFKKEMIESVRSYKYLILAAVFIGFAIMDPLILKLLPKIMEMQGDTGIDFSQIMKITQASALRSYMGNLMQIGSLVIVLSLMGIIAEEIKNQLLVMPITKKLSFAGVVLSKGLHYSLVVAILIPISMMLNYYYITMLFQEEVITLQQTLRSALLLSCYFIFIINLLICIGSFIKKTGVVALLTLGTSLALPLLNRINWLEKFNPYYFVQKAHEIKSPIDSSIVVPLLVLGAYITILNGAAISKLKVSELER